MNRIFALGLVLVVFVSWAATFLIKGQAPPATPADTLSLSFFAPVPSAVTAVCVVVFFFDKWLWRPVGALMGRPFLGGTWHGTLRSDYKEPATHKGRGDIEVVAVITQSWSSIAFRTYTAESGSVTTAATLVHEPDGKVVLEGVYLNTPRPEVRDRSDRHLGAIHLQVDGEKLGGEYFNSRTKTGEMSLTRVSKKRVASFEEGIALAAKTARPSKT